MSASKTALLCAQCGEPIAWFDAGDTPLSGWIHTELDGGDWSHKAQPPAPPPTPRVLFCPFCGGGTLLLGEDKFQWKCLKCKREFGVTVKL